MSEYPLKVFHVNRHKSNTPTLVAADYSLVHVDHNLLIDPLYMDTEVVYSSLLCLLEAKYYIHLYLHI